MKINNKNLSELDLGEKVSRIEFNDGVGFSFEPDECPEVTELIETEESNSVVIKLVDMSREQLANLPEELIRRLQIPGQFRPQFSEKLFEITREN